MVAVIAGAGLGVFNSNVTTGAGVSGQAELGQARERVYVNAATGNLVLQNTDEQVMGLGLGFSLLRTYNSQANFDGDNNDQWRLGFISTVSQDGADYLRTTADGFIQRFKPSGIAGEYISFEGQGHADKLVVKAGNKIEISSDGDVTETYTDGKLTSRKTPQGEVTVNYSGSKPVDIRLTVLNANQSATTTETLTISYYPDTDPAAGLLRSLSVKDERGVMQNRVEYLYDSEKRLQSVVIDKTPQLTTDSNNVALNKDGNKFVIEYGYAGTSKQINLVRQYQASNKDSSNDNKTELAISYYDANEPAYRAGRVKTLTQGMYQTTYEYLDDNRTRVIQGGQAIDYEFDSQDRLVKVSYDLKGGVSTTSYSYNSNGQLETVTDGLGQKTEYLYDNNGNVRQISAPGQPTIIRTYNSNNKLLTEQHGSLVTRYVYDNSGQLLRFAIAADGGVSEYRYNNFKQMIQQRVYHGIGYNISALGVAEAPQLALLESWVAGLSDKSAQQLTEFSYDVRGQVKTKTQYASVNSSGHGEGTASVWSYLYDLRGQLLQETKPKGYSTASLYDETVTYAYDGLGRLLTSVDAQSHSTTIVNADHNRTQQIRLDNGRYETLTFDKSGQVVSKQVRDQLNNKDLGTERFYYDDAGRQTALQDQYGQWTYRFYEENGALAAEVNPVGAVTRYYYDLAGRLERTVAYVSRMTLSNGWTQAVPPKMPHTLSQVDLAIGDWLTKDPAKTAENARRESRIVYQNNLKQYEIDAAGFVTAYKYDNDSRLQQKLIYAKAVNDPLAAQPLTGFDFNGALASSESYGYDSAGRLEIVTNGENYRTQHYYDKAGRKIATRQYANQVVNNTVAASGADLLEHWRYDGQGRVIAHVSTDGAISRFEYNLNGQVERSIQYAEVVRSLGIGATLSWPTGASRITSNSYDGNGRLIQQTQPDGQTTFYRYDAVGNVTEKWQGKAAINTANMIDILRTDFSGEHPLISKGMSAGATDQVYLKSGRMVMSRQTAMLPADRAEHWTGLGVASSKAASLDAGFEYQFDLQFSESSKNYFLPYLRYRSWNESDHTRLGLHFDGSTIKYYTSHNGVASLNAITNDANSTIVAGQMYRVRMQTSADGVLVIVLKLNDSGQEQELSRKLLAAPQRSRDYPFSLHFESNAKATGFTNKTYIDNMLIRAPELPALVDTNQLHTVERYQYDVNGNRIAVLDANANAAVGASATQAQVNTAFNANPSARYVYNQRGQLVESRDAEGGRTLYFYDQGGRLTSKIDAERLLTHYEYNSFDEVVTVRNPANPVPMPLYRELLQEHDRGGNLNQGRSWDSIPTKVLNSYISSNAQVAVNRSADDSVQTIGRDFRGLEQMSYRDLTLTTPGHTDTKGMIGTAYSAIGLVTRKWVTQRYAAADWSIKSAALENVFNYDKRGLTDTVIRNGVVQSDTDYDAFGRVTLQKTLAKANVETSYQLSAADRQNNQLGRVITTSQTITQGAAQQLRQDIIRYDAFGRVLETQDALGAVTRYQYDDANRSHTVTNLKTGISTETRRNLLGRVSEVVIKQGSTVLQTSRYEYDANGNLTKSFLNDVPQESRTYNKNNQLQFVTDATGSRSETVYDKNGRVLKTVVDVDGLKLSSEWDFSAGRSEVKQTEGSRVSWTGYDKNGRVKYLDRLEVVDGVSYRVRTSYSYDQAGQKIEVVNGQRFTVDANQKVTGVADNSAAQTQKFDYDQLGRLVRQYTVLGSSRVNEVQYSYNDADQLIEKKELLSATQQKRTFYSYNQAGDVQAEAVSHSELNGKLRVSLQKFDYDSKGRRIASHQYLSLLNTDKVPTAAISAAEMTTLIDNAAGPVASSYVAYDAQDRVVARINPTGSRSFTRYDALGRVTEQFTSELASTLSNEELAQLKAGNFGYGDGIYSGLGDARTSYVYDNQNRLAYQLVSTGNQAMVTGYRYDAEGKLSQTRQFATLATYAANPAKSALDSLATSSQDRVSQQFYDSADRLRYVIDSSGLVTQYVYNVHGQRVSETRHADLIGTKGVLAADWQQGSLSYTQLQTAYPDSAIAAGSRQISTEYDLLGRVSKITYPELHPQTGQPYTERYQYNAAGQKVSFTDRNGQLWQYQYDMAGRLQAEFTPLLTADDKVQVQLSNGEYVNATGYGKKHYQYDAQGNLTQLTEGMVRQLTDTVFYQESRNGNVLTSQARTTSFAYDVAGRQTRVTQPVAENAPATYTETAYDALGRTISAVQYSNGAAVKADYKVYDSAGLLKYDITATDASLPNPKRPSNGYVTEYQYNSFGQQSKLIRYAGTLAIDAVIARLFDPQAPLLVVDPSPPPFAPVPPQPPRPPEIMGHIELQVADVATDSNITVTPLALPPLSNPGWSLTGARIIDTEYDTAGRKVAVFEQSRAFSYWESGTVKTTQARPETRFEYNSFGEVWKTSVKATPTEWLHSYNWYDNLGRQTHTLDAAGYLSRRSYNSLGEVETYTEYARAIATTNLSQQTPPALPVAGDQQTGADRSWSYGYDKLGRRISETLTGALYHQNASSSFSSQTVTTTTGYDGYGQVIRRTDATGQLDFSYNALGQLVQQLGKDVAVAGNVRDLSALSSLSQQTQLMRQQSRYEYDVFGNMVQSRELAGVQANDSLDKITRYKYNSRGQAVQQSDVLGAGLQRVVESHYQADGKIQRQEVEFDEQVAGQINTVRRRFVTSYSYDAQGQQRQRRVESNTAEQPAQLKVIDRQDNEFNAFGEMVSQYRLNSTGAMQLQHRFVYNTSGLLVNTDEKDGAISTHSYDLAGRLVQVSHALNGTQRFVLDALGRQSQVQQQGMQATQFYVTTQQFDRWGNVTRLTDARGYSYDYQYNHLNKVVAEFKPETTAVHIDGSAESLRPASYFRYNSQGLLLLETDANGNQKKYQYDASGNVIVTTDAEGRSTSYGYDLMGRLVAQQGPAGLIETTLYNQFGLATETGRVVKVQNAQAQWYQYDTVNQYQYNAAAQRISSTDANGDLTHYRYNGKDQLIMSLSATGLRKKYDYDALGNQILASSQLGSSAALQTSKTTSADGIVIRQRDLSGVETRYQFVQTALLNAAGNPSGSGNSNRVQRVEITDAGERNKKLRYDYYANGWLKSVTDELNNNTSTYVYNEHGQRILETHVATDLSGNVFTQNVQTSYDELGRVRKVEVSDENNKLTSKVTYRYDAVGNRRAMTVANGLEGDIQPVQAIPLTSLLTLPLKADSAFTTKQLQLNQLFETDEVALLRLELAAPVPDWLQLDYQPDGSFVLSNKPGKKAPLLSVAQVEVSLNAIERSTGRVMATNKLLFRLVAPSELEVKADALPNQQLRWHQIARGLLKPISFVSSFIDKDGDAITIKPPVIFANGRELSAAEFSRYFSWDNKKAELTIKAELAELEAQNPELTLKVDVKASSLGNTVVTEQTKSLLISIKKNNKPVVVSELGATTPGYLLPDQTVLHGVRAGTGAAANMLSLDINSYFTDADGDALRLVKVEGLPNFLFSVRSEDGSGRIQNWPGDQSQAASFRPLAVGIYNLQAIVTDGFEESVVNFRLIVNPADTADPAASINWPADRSIGEGQDAQFNLNSATNPALKFRPAGEHKLPVGLTLHADGRITGVLNNAAVQPPKNAQGQITSNGWDKKASQFGVKVIDLNTGLASDTRNLPLTLRNTPVAYKDSAIIKPVLTVLTGYSDTSSEWLKLADIPASFVTASEGRIVTETPVSNRSRVELVSSSEKYRLDWNGVSHSGAIYIKKGAAAPQEAVQLRVIDGGSDGHGSHIVTLPVQTVASPVRYNAGAPAAVNLYDVNAALNVSSFFDGFVGFADKNAANQPIVSFGVSFTLNGSRYVSGAMAPLQFDAATGSITGWTRLSDAVRRQLNGTDVAMQFDIYYQWQGVMYSTQAPATKAVRMTYQPPLEARFENFSPSGTVAEGNEVSFNVVMSKGRPPYTMPAFSAAGASRQVSARPLAAGDYLISQVNDSTFNITWRIGTNAVGGSGWNTANVALQVSSSKDADGVLVPTASANIAVENRPVPWDGSNKQLEFSKSINWSTVYAEKVEIGSIPQTFVTTADGRLVTTQKNGNLSSLRLASPVPAGFSLEWNESTHTGTLYMTDKYSLPLPSAIAVELHDSVYGWLSGSIKLNIESQRPPVGAVGKQNFVEGQDIEIKFREIIKDPDGTPIQFGAFKIEKKIDGVGNDGQSAWLPSSMGSVTFDAVSGIMSGNLGYESAGIYKVTLHYSDAIGGVPTVFEVNIADKVKPVTQIRAIRAEDLTFDEGKVSVKDLSEYFSPAEPAGSDHNYSISQGSIPGHYTLSSWGMLRVDASYSDAGTYNFTLKVTNSIGGFIEVPVTLTIVNKNQPPVAQTIPDITNAKEGVYLNENLARYFSDGDNDRLSFTAKYYEDTVEDNPHAQRPETFIPGLTLEPDGRFHGTPQNHAMRSYTVVVTATDPAGNTVSRQFKISIADTPVDNAPTVVITSRTISNVRQNEPFIGYNASTHFSDDGALSYWRRDYTPLPDGLEINTLTGQITGTPRVSGVHRVLITAREESRGRIVESEIIFQIEAAQVQNRAPVKVDWNGHLTLGGGNQVVRTHGYQNWQIPFPAIEAESNRLYYLEGTLTSSNINNRYHNAGKTYARHISIALMNYVNDPDGGPNPLHVSVNFTYPAADYLMFDAATNKVIRKQGVNVPRGRLYFTVTYSDGLASLRLPFVVGIAEDFTGETPPEDNYNSVPPEIAESGSLLAQQPQDAALEQGNLSDLVTPPISEQLVEPIPATASDAPALAAPVVGQQNLTNTAAVTNSTPVYAKTRSYWYTYDKTNQVVIDGGSINAQTGVVDIHQQGRYVSYNAAGQQDFVVTIENGKQKGQRFEYNNRNQLAVVYQSAEAYQGLWVNSGSFYKFDYNYQPLLSGDVTKTLNSHIDWRRLQAYEYDNVGRLTATYDYGTQALAHELKPDSEHPWGYRVLLDMRGTLQSVQRSIYNADGQVTQVRTNQLQADMSGEALKSFFSNKLKAIDNLPVADGVMLRLQDYVPTAEASMVSGTVTTYQNFNAQGLAEQTRSSVTKASGAVDQYSWQRSYTARDTLLESKVTGTASSGTKGGQFKDATTFTDYDAHGNKVLVVEGNEANGSELSIRQMLYAADGSLLRMQQSALAKVDGDALAQVKTRLAQIRAGQSTALHQSRESRHISSNGDYLGEIAVLRGDENNARDNWYFSSTIKEQHFSSELAAGNASERHTVRAGDTLQSLAQLYYGNADYWYLIAAANGLSSVQGPATQPAAGEAAPVAQQLVEGMTLDIPARASSFNSHNNFKPMDLAKIIGDTTPTVPYLPPPPAAGCNAVAAVVIIAVVVMVTYATNGAMTKDAVTWGAKAMAAATAAAAGDAAGQITAIALNQQNGFDAGRTLRSAGTAFVTAGVSHGLGQTAPSSGEGFWASRAGDTVQLSHAGRAAVAASGVLSGMAINRLTTGHSGFSWRQVASSAMMAGVGGRLPLEGTGNIIQDTFSGIAQSGLQYGLAKALGDDKVSWNFRNVATDAFGNALGNSIVKGLSSERTLSAKEQAELDQKVAAVGRKEVAKLDAKTRLQLQQSTDAIATDVGTRLASDGAAGFDALTDVLQQRNDAMMDQYRDKRADAAAKNGGMWQQTKADIAAIDATVAANKQQRAVQAAQIQQRYDQRTIDFRMANPTYRRPEPLFSYDSALAADNAMWGAGKQRAQLVQQAKDVFVQSYEKGEFTAAWGLTAGVEAGAGADGEVGKFLSVNFKSGDVSFGVYGSLEAASNLNIPMPEAHAGGAFTFYPTSDYEAALQGKYVIYGGTFDPKVANINISAGLVKTNNNQLTGFQAGAVLTTPSLAKLPGHSGFVKAGMGDAVRLGTFNYKSWW